MTITAADNTRQLTALLAHTAKHDLPAIANLVLTAAVLDVQLRCGEGSEADLLAWAATLSDVVWSAGDFRTGTGWHIHAQGQLGDIAVRVWTVVPAATGDSEREVIDVFSERAILATSHGYRTRACEVCGYHDDVDGEGAWLDGHICRWDAGSIEPAGVTAVIDRDGVLIRRLPGGGWRADGAIDNGRRATWEYLTGHYGPVTQAEMSAVPAKVGA